MARARADAATRLVAGLSAMDSPEKSALRVHTADDLLEAFVAGCDARGRYFACPYLLRRLFWWQEVPVLKVARLTDVLVGRGDLEVRPIGHNIYDDPGVMTDIACLLNPRRFARFAARQPIPAAVRRAVLERDGFRCVTCGTRDALTMDHVIPWSRGGSDEPTNLQAMCRPCNCRKGARV